MESGDDGKSLCGVATRSYVCTTYTPIPSRFVSREQAMQSSFWGFNALVCTVSDAGLMMCVWNQLMQHQKHFQYNCRWHTQNQKPTQVFPPRYIMREFNS
ncbi:hypothetical protein Pelo_16908 [Pelomyxa schiedti]|nr:hypothetical protein Pelo_16908 [Pelomyxa schiedti]